MATIIGWILLDDSLVGTSGNDVIYGYSGNDTLIGNAGNDVLYGDDGNDLLAGGSGDDYVSGGTGDDTLRIGDAFGNDTLIGGEGGMVAGDLLYANMTVGATLTFTAPEAGTISSGGYTAIFSEIERVLLGSGNDTVTGSSGADSIATGAGDDSVIGGAGNDTIDLGAGNDTFGSWTNDDGNDRVLGGDGNDLIVGGGGNDTLYGDAGNDTLAGGTGNDLLYGGTGNDVFYITDGHGIDTVYGEADYDLLYFTNSAVATGVTVTYTGTGAGSYAFAGTTDSGTFSSIEAVSGTAYSDTLSGALSGAAVNLAGNAGNDSLIGSAGNDTLDGGAGDDTLRGGAGADSLLGSTGMDYADYSTSGAAVRVDLSTGTGTGGDAQGDTLNGIDGIIGSAYDDTLIGFDGQGTVSGDIYTNVFYGGAGNDLMDGRGGDDSLYGGDDSDTISGGSGSDLLSGDAGADLLYGDAGNDTLSGGLGDDTLDGGDGDDQLDGGAGNDRLFGGAGSDTLAGGTGSDTLFAGIGDVVVGGEDADGTDRDVLVLLKQPGWTYKIAYDEGNAEAGWVTVTTDTGQTGTIRFDEIEAIRKVLAVPCFTPGSRLLTLRGEVAVEDLAVGDMVLTRDSGYRPVRWVGRRRLTPEALFLHPELRPILIRRGALGPDRPSRDMMVSRQHRMLVSDGRAELLFDESEVLVRALHLLGLPGIEEAQVPEVTYLHILFDRHEIVMADGAWTESFQPGDRTLGGLDQDQRAELLAIFPELATEAGADSYEPARATLRAHEARALLAA